ncbi:uncharacterized protein L201_005207 [Kwoniella dendrophila CBS 6074]|uniref:Uncharacterized protein n=1 Tax=Kwoniella dendrophila CBS 6074 TaxID=1295534 RepID=A0AAX4JZH5_9TREE
MSRRRSYRKLIILRNILKQARLEKDKIDKSNLDYSNQVALKAYEEFMDRFESLIELRKETVVLGKQRKSLLRELSILKKSNLPTVRKKFFRLRKRTEFIRNNNREFYRGKYLERNLETFDYFLKSNELDRKSTEWTNPRGRDMYNRTKWDKQIEYLTKQLIPVMEGNQIVKDDIEALRAILARYPTPPKPVEISLEEFMELPEEEQEEDTDEEEVVY